MFREMRRAKQNLGTKVAEEIMNEGQTGIFAVIGDEGYPYGVPVNFAYCDGKIYFHCAKEGHKIDAIKKEPKVSFTVITSDEVRPATFDTKYKSAIAFGEARLLDDDDTILKGIRLIVDKYSAGFKVEAEKEIKSDWGRLGIVEIDVQHLSAKRSLK